MNTLIPKFKFEKKEILNKIKGNPIFYANRDNAVNTYYLILGNYELIKLNSNSEHTQFDQYIDELKKVILIKEKKSFTLEFAKLTLHIAFYLKKVII